ncbi:MAG: PilZ domain-containing protein [Candidatus Omnitrophica bacterium]|nr:PilZ domain-containing protein [Candidatus Omnitrophota bacterium]
MDNELENKSEHSVTDGVCPPICRRLFRRIIADETALLYSEGKEEKLVMVRDISVTGIGIENNFPLAVGEECKIFIQSAILRESIKKKTRVVWCKKTEDNVWQAGLELYYDDPIQFA